MRKYAAPVALLTLMLSGAAVLAATSSPSPAAKASPTPRPSVSATAKPTASPSAAPSASPSASQAAQAKAEPSFSARVKPLQIGGMATLRELKAGGALVTLKLTGLVENERWLVDIDGGTIARPNENMEIAFRSGEQVTRLGTETIRIRLTKAEMSRFAKARRHGGVVAEVSDGTRIASAEFAARAH